MIELLRRAFPVNKGKIHPIVLEVAAHAVFAVGILHLQPGVIAPLFGKQPGNLRVALQTLERGSAGAKFVATRTLRSSAKRLVRFRERPRRDLRVRREYNKRQKQECRQAAA